MEQPIEQTIEIDMYRLWEKPTEQTLCIDVIPTHAGDYQIKVSADLLDDFLESLNDACTINSTKLVAKIHERLEPVDPKEWYGCELINPIAIKCITLEDEDA